MSDQTTYVPIRGHPQGLSMIRTLAAYIGGDRNLGWLLRATGKFRATDPRDKLYALLGLVEDGNSFSWTNTTSYKYVLGNFGLFNIESRHGLRT